MSTTIKTIKEKVVPIAEKYGVDKMSIFGSYAIGEQSENSDIDFVIEMGELKGLIQFCSLRLALQDVLGKNVDLMTYSMLYSTFKNGVKEVMIYER